MAKGKDMSNMLTNGAMFSTFKRTDSHNVRGRPTRKDGVVIYERLFRNVSFRELKIAKESWRITSWRRYCWNRNQTRNQWMLSVNRRCEQSVTTDERRTKVLGADKEKVHGDRTLGNIGGNNNKDAMFDWSGSQSEDKCNCHTRMTSIMITTCFYTKREHYRLWLSYFCH